jgi:hypothetical protein
MNKRRFRDTFCVKNNLFFNKVSIIIQVSCVILFVISSLLPEGGCVVIPEKIRSAIDNGFGRRLGQLPEQYPQFRSGHPGGHCDQTISTDSAWISSPNYPLDYDANTICVYTILKHDDVCQLEFTFEDFDLEDSRPSCQEDYLELGSGNRICGSLIPDFKREYIIIIFSYRLGCKE